MRGVASGAAVVALLGCAAGPNQQDQYVVTADTLCEISGLSRPHIGRTFPEGLTRDQHEASYVWNEFDDPYPTNGLMCEFGRASDGWYERIGIYEIRFNEERSKALVDGSYGSIHVGADTGTCLLSRSGDGWSILSCAVQGSIVA